MAGLRVLGVGSVWCLGFAAADSAEELERLAAELARHEGRRKARSRQ